MFGFDHHAHTLGFQHLIDGAGDVGGQLFLDLQPPRVAMHDAGELGDAHHPVSREITHMRLACDGQHVMLAETHHRYVSQNDEFVITAHLLEGALHIVARVRVVAGEKFAIGPGDPGGCVQKALARWIVSRPLDKHAHGRFGLGLGDGSV